MENYSVLCNSQNIRPCSFDIGYAHYSIYNECTFRNMLLFYDVIMCAVCKENVKSMNDLEDAGANKPL